MRPRAPWCHQKAVPRTHQGVLTEPGNRYTCSSVVSQSCSNIYRKHNVGRLYENSNADVGCFGRARSRLDAIGNDAFDWAERGFQ